MPSLALELYGVGWIDIMDAGLSPELHRLTHCGATRSEWLAYVREQDHHDWLASAIGYSMF